MTDVGAKRAPTMFDLWGPDRHRDAQPVSRLAVEAIRLAWQAGRRELAVMLAMQAVTIAGVLAGALVTRSLLGEFFEADRTGGGVGGLLPELAALAFVTAVLGVAHLVQLHRQRILGELSQRHGEGRVLEVTGSVDLAAFDDPPFHDAVARASLAVRLLPAVVSALSVGLRSLAGALGAVVALLVLVPVFAPVVLLALAPLLLAARRRGRAFHRFAHAITPRDRERAYLAELLVNRDAAQEVRAYELASFLRERHRALWDERVGKLRAVADRELGFSVVAGLGASVIVSAALGALIALTLSDHVSLAAAATGAVTIALLGQRLNAAAISAGSLAEAALFIDDYLTLVSHGGRRADREGQAGGRSGAPHIRVENVSFSYRGARGPALRGVSLEVRPGEVVALVGENGSGKTSLAKLLAGLYVPDEGRVTLNGAGPASADPDELCRNTAVIFQDFMRYALTARENVGFGRHERLSDEEAVRRAAHVAGASDALERLPDGYDTMLGSAFAGGTDLSIGQWQRVALARALFRDARFVILDEPTAALDARAEHELFVRIRELLAGRSVLLISHRFPSVRMADRIHVMHEGRIVESGTHDELLAAQGRYAELFMLQAAPYR